MLIDAYFNSSNIKALQQKLKCTVFLISTLGSAANQRQAKWMELLNWLFLQTLASIIAPRYFSFPNLIFFWIFQICSAENME